ncbi:hypothetical protein ABPG72_015294 [Tetrahymena utriculariae]
MNYNSYGNQQQQQYQQYNQYQGGPGQNQQQQQQQPLPIKTIIGNEELKLIVKCLNDKPFNYDLKLVTFDELSNIDLLDVLYKVLLYLDKNTFENIKQKMPEQIGSDTCNFLNILGYPIPPPPNDVEYQTQLLQGEKRVVNPILYYLLSRLEEHQQRAYLAKYLVPFTLPEDIPFDEEMKTFNDKYKDLQAEFQVHHQDYQAALRESQNPTELKKVLASLEGEREQLISKINISKSKNTMNPEFQALLEETNLLRKEQEEEARLDDKIYQQKSQLEYTDQQLLTAQQRLLDAQKSMDPSNTPEQMLQSMRNEVKKNRELSTMRLAIEINEKKKKLEATEKLLMEPPMTQGELSNLDNQLVVLRRAVTILEEKLAKKPPQDDSKLLIYRQSAQQVARKKEKAIEELKRTEEEQTALEKKVQALTEKLNKERGAGIGGISDMNAYVKTVAEKAAKCKEMRKQLSNLEQEKILLSRTEEVLKKNKAEYDQMIKKIEKEKNVEGISQIIQDGEDLTEANNQMNNQKEKKLEEFSQLTVKYNQMKKEKQVYLKQQAEEQKEMQKKMEEVEQVWKTKKAEYDRVILKSESEINQLEQEVKKLKEEVYRDDTKITSLKYSQQILDLKLNRLNEEEKYQKGEKQLSSQYKSYVELFNGEARKLEEQIIELRKQRELVKENHEPSIRQQQMFADLKKFLTLKLQVSRKQNNAGKGAGGDYNILTIN